ncbi:hypothetical protein IQ06DRAFT_76430 [Phaeosphaeriaceae sp. SRC1lsM3a]|nr:hypothetical protein IQ06DRAFT_76430 [Stagonospora sp. SRC1lsM3a]
MSSYSLPAFGPSCPKGGSWYACSTGSNFVGCCAVNPCASTCSQGSIRPAAFVASQHGTFDDASCPTNSNFYTCNSTNPVFMGCCKTGTNPCRYPGTCDVDNLVPAFLGTEDLKRQYGASGGASSSSARSSTTASGAGASTLVTMTSTTTPTSASQASAAALPKKDSPPVAAIAGGAAGGAFAIALAIGLMIYYYCCYAKKSRRGHEETVVRRESDLAAMLAVQGKGSEMRSPDAPPGYVSPNPNDYYGAHAGRYHQYIPEPQELSGETHGVAVAGFARKPVTHQRNLSELSGDTAIRSEMETPVGSPHVATSSSPNQPHASWQGSAGGFNGSTWAPQQNWQTQTSEGNVHGPAQGRGLNGTDTNHRTTRP